MSDSLEDLKPVYLIHGTEDLRLSQALARLKRRVGNVADLDFNYESFDGENADVDDVIAAANTLPFASERRLVVVSNVDRMSKAAWEELAGYVARPAGTTVLVLTAPKLAKNLRLYKAIDRLGGVAEYAAPRKSEYPREVVGLFCDRGRSVTLDAAEMLVSAVGCDLRRLSAEVDKTIAFAGVRTEVTCDDVAQVVSTTAQTSVFELLEALSDRDLRRGLDVLDRLLADGESIFGVHALVLRQVRDLIVARSLADRGGGSAREVSDVVRRPEWQVRNLPRQARNFSTEELVDSLRDAAEAETRMKTSREPRLAFERWIVEFCG
jgi:DNA polymerase-3 subunit delta